MHTWSYFGPQNKFFDNHITEIVTPLGQWCMEKSMKCEIPFRELTATRHNRVPLSLTVQTVLIAALPHKDIYGVFGQPLLQGSTPLSHWG